MAEVSGEGYRPAYTLDNTWRAARERLEKLETACDPLTARHLDEVGLRAGWHCLEVGAGAGSVTRMLCDRVGPEGRVVAVDLEPGLLAGVAAPNLEVRRLDIVVDALPEAAFDLVHTRMVLLHLPQRDELVLKLARALRPGGVLLLEETDLRATFAAEEDVFRPSMVTIYRPLPAAGWDVYWPSTGMLGRLEAAGLVDIESLTEPMTFMGGSPLAEFFQLSYQQLLEGQPYTDAERTVIEAGAAAIAQPGGPYLAWEMITAWGRRP